MTSPHENYISLMCTVRGRLDVIARLREQTANDFARAETAAFHGRKVVEGIAFGCLIAIENGLPSVPKDATGKWNAEDILKGLKKKGLDVLPISSAIREATPAEKRDHRAKAVIDGIPERRLTQDALIGIYQRLHRWAHELNPYTRDEHETFYAKHSATFGSQKPVMARPNK